MNSSLHKLFCMTFLILSLSATASIFPTPETADRFRRTCNRQPQLHCRFRGTTGHNVTGTVTFSALYRGMRPEGSRCVVRIRASITELTTGLHGFHIHTYGDESAADGTSAGGHFSNPDGDVIAHGLPRSPERHWGDLGNLVADDVGVASFDRIDHVITLEGVLGRGMIIHELADKGARAQPTGGAGSRQASCVIGLKNPDL